MLNEKSLLINNEDDNKDNKDNNENPNLICRFCYDLEPREGLFKPCKCTDPIHRSCLNSWIKEDNKPDPKCPTCQYQFIKEQTTVIKKKERRSFQSMWIKFRDSLGFWQIMFYLLHIICVQGIRWDSGFGIKTCYEAKPHGGVTASYIIGFSIYVIIVITFLWENFTDYIIKDINIINKGKKTRLFHYGECPCCLTGQNYCDPWYALSSHNKIENVTYYSKYCVPPTYFLMTLLVYGVIHAIGIILIQFWFIPSNQIRVNLEILAYPSSYTFFIGLTFVTASIISVLILIGILFLLLKSLIFCGRRSFRCCYHCFYDIEEETKTEISNYQNV